MLGVWCGAWKVQLGLGCVMQLGLKGSNFEHLCFINGHSENQHAIGVLIFRRRVSLEFVRFQIALDRPISSRLNGV